jgi:putative hemin transport protein
METTTITEPTSAAIARAWEGICKAKPGIRIREAAAALALSEAQLLATTVGSEAIRLQPRWAELLKQLPALGRVMSLTRNDACVLEHKGVFEKVNVFGQGNHRMATVIGPIETRVFLKSWHSAFAVEQQKDGRTLTSIQVFDHEGHAITKIYLQDESPRDAFRQLVNDFRAAEQSAEQPVTGYEPETFANPLPADDLMEAWAALEDTHDFYPMLRKFKAHRLDAVRAANGRFSQAVSTEVIQELLEKAAAQKLPIMIFAGNRGNIQIHQGPVRTIRMLERSAERWLNVLDPDFNMHLRIDLLAEAWVVRKPTADGTVTSVECYDKRSDLAVQFFGLRKPGTEELNDWRKLVSELQPI